jgi:hypothetical protein
MHAQVLVTYACVCMDADMRYVPTHRYYPCMLSCSSRSSSSSSSRKQLVDKNHLDE